MAITLSNGTTTVTLPEQSCWSDEYQWDPVAQATDIALNGALVIQEAAQLAGRPITLTTDEGGDWMKRSDLDALMALANMAGGQYTLTLNDARTFTVAFRRSSGTPAVKAVPVFATNSSDAVDLFAVTINFMTVA